MRLVITTNRFEREYRLMRKRGKNVDKMQSIVQRLANDEPLEPRQHDHALSGNYQNRRECHIEPDWLLIYKLDEVDGTPVLILERTGTHSDLF